jgi:hypothetical protein
MPAGEALAAHSASGRAGKTAKHKTARRRSAKKERASKPKKNSKNEPKPALESYMIFGNERRPTIMDAIHVNGGQVDPADIDRRIAVLWDAETDKAKYYGLADKDRERYADEKAAFDWEGGAAARTVKKMTAAQRKRAAFSEDAAQTPSAHDVAPSDRTSLSAAAASVYSYAVGYLQPFFIRIGVRWVDPKMARNQRTCWAALQLIAAGRGLLRAPACNRTLRVASGGTASGQALMRRALLLLAPGELQELQLHPPGVTQGTCDFIRSMLNQMAAGFHSEIDDGTERHVPVSRALTSLRVVKAWGNKAPFLAALMQQCAANFIELECSVLDDDAVRALPHCTRLKSLTFFDIFWKCPPAAWLGLSQLHTLRGVSLRVVSAAAIAAALPQLHTLHLCHYDARVEFSPAAFYDELLPRLRSFHLEGLWPKPGEETEMIDAAPLPLLEDLMWCSEGVNLPRQLIGARPSTLHTSDANLLEWLQAAHGAGADSATAVTSPLARARSLTVRLEGTPPDATFMARLLRAAPQLRQFTFDVFYNWSERWVISDAFTEPAFAELVHSRLRHIAITTGHCPLDVPVLVPSWCGVQLRQRHFPCLRRLTVYDEEYPMWVPRPAGRRKTSCRT